MNTDMIFR